jgi:hypothetical protein
VRRRHRTPARPDPPAAAPAGAWPRLGLRELDRQGAVELALQVGERDGVIYRRSFRTRDLSRWHDYRMLLERIARHAAEGCFGWFVDVQGRADGQVRVTLYDRFFDGEAIHCEARARREFDGSADDAVASVAEFTSELRARADAENAARLDATLDGAAHADEAQRVAAERARAAQELARILRDA